MRFPLQRIALHRNHNVILCKRNDNVRPWSEGYVEEIAMQSSIEGITLQSSVEGITMQSSIQGIRLQSSVEGITMRSSVERMGYYISRLIFLRSFGVGPKVL